MLPSIATRQTAILQSREQGRARNGKGEVPVTDLAVRFLVGGFVVSGFALLGDLFRPKTFAGLFAAAPSVALASLSLTVHSKGRFYAAAEAQSMIVGAIAFLCMVAIASFLMLRGKFPAVRVTLSLLPLWLGVAMGLWFVFLR
jgi:hypothetical protein